MKRFNSSSESLGALISICPPKGQEDINEEEKYSESNDKGYSQEFQAMLDSLDQEDCAEFTGKKRRLRSDQVKSLERHFEVENKLDPERKSKLADELGLHQRQVAIWFQNRRARWKTKQLEKDYGLLKANYNSLKTSYEDIRQQNAALIEKVRVLKEKVCRGESEESSESVKEEESPASENNESIVNDALETDLNYFQDKYEDDDNHQMMCSGDGDQDRHENLKFSLGVNGSSSSSSSCSSNSLMAKNWFPVKMCSSSQQQPRVEEQSPFGSDEPNCNSFFSVDQPPTLYWYFPEQ